MVVVAVTEDLEDERLREVETEMGESQVDGGVRDIIVQRDVAITVLRQRSVVAAASLSVEDLRMRKMRSNKASLRVWNHSLKERTTSLTRVMRTMVEKLHIQNHARTN
ncbi:hypothetical protein ACFX15_002643 [Malus domestica]